MSHNTRFAIALHILVLAAVDCDEPVTSQRAAKSVGTNPVFIRRINCKLSNSGLIQVQMGKYGGIYLSKSPEKITLIEIYRAVEPGDLLRLHASQPSDQCFVGRHILDALAISVAPLERQFEDGLARITLADVARNVLRLAGAKLRSRSAPERGSHSNV